MAVKPIPEGYRTVIPYLIVDGAPKLLEFMKSAFGAKEGHISKTPDGKIVHGEVQLGDSHIWFSDAREPWKATPCMIQLYMEDVDAVYKRALEAGATSVQEPSNQFYGDRSGGVRDFAGNQWWIATHVEDVPHEEMAAREAEYMKKQKAQS